MRTRTWLSAVAATGLVAVGAALPALASAENAPAAGSDPSPAEQHSSGNGMPDMGRMHGQMMQQMPEMARMHEQMMQQAPGMARMHEQMMSDHPREAMQREDQEEER